MAKPHTSPKARALIRKRMADPRVRAKISAAKRDFWRRWRMYKAAWDMLPRDAQKQYEKEFLCDTNAHGNYK